jgi:hypothetical protein
LGWIIVREAAAQVKGTDRRGERFPRLSLACSYAEGQAFASTSRDFETSLR